VLPLVDGESVIHDEGRAVPPGFCFRPAALGHVGAHAGVRHLARAHQVEMDLARHLRRQPAVRLPQHVGQAGFAGDGEQFGPDLPLAI
jgi:hypothetical protein